MGIEASTAFTGVVEARPDAPLAPLEKSARKPLAVLASPVVLCWSASMPLAVLKESVVLSRTVSSPPKELYNPKAFFTHAAWLDQGCPHCPKFPTAASRRSLGRVSVPVWLIILSDQLPIVALVGLYPTN